MESLDVPQLNKDMKDMIRTRTVTCDKKFQYIQMASGTTSSALTTTADKLMDPSYKADNEALLTTIIDALALLGHVQLQLGYRWGNSVFPDLSKTYEGLVSSDIPFTKHLYGDEVLKTMEELKRKNMELNKILQKTTEAPRTGAIKNNSSSRENDLSFIHIRNSSRNVPPTQQVALFFHNFNIFVEKYHIAEHS